jgi:cyd operon protein YbgT
MWYFTWVLGLGFALTFAILNGLWFEMHSPPDDPSEN